MMPKRLVWRQVGTDYYCADWFPPLICFRIERLAGIWIATFAGWPIASDEEMQSVLDQCEALNRRIITERTTETEEGL